MSKILVFALALLPVFAHAAVTREIDGVKYYLADDFDTADGECVIRGEEYAEFFYSYEKVNGPILYLNSVSTSTASFLFKKKAPTKVRALFF